MLAPSPSRHCIPIRYGPVSLWEMINFSLYGFVWALKLLESEAAVANERAIDEEHGPIQAADLKRFRMNFANGIAPSLNAMFIAEGRLGRLATIARLGGTYGELAHELHALRSDIVDATEFERFYHYPREKGLLIIRAAADWAAISNVFPGAREDISGAVDCYALGHNNASIYHSMMVLELGLASLAKRLGVKVSKDRSTWGPIIKKIRDCIDDRQKALASTPAGRKPPTASAAKREKVLLESCQEAAIEFRYFTEVWRNHMAHGRAHYDENDAKKVLDHVRTFMEVIIDKLKLKQVKIA